MELNVAAALAAKVPAPRSAPDDGFAAPAFALVRGEAQGVQQTASRRAGPRAWLRSVVWLVGAGLHPLAGPSTVRVAEDLAARMDFTLGLVLYDLDGTVRRLGLSRATVKRHVKILRELGALVWVRHGSKRNLRVPGRAYTATATIYGAVIPLVYDDAMGHRLVGAGYEARVCGVTEAGRERAVEVARTAAEAKRKRPVRRRRRSGREPHSPGSYPQCLSAGKTLSPSEKNLASGESDSPTQRRKKRRAGGPKKRNRFGNRLHLAGQLIAELDWLRGCHVRRIAWVSQHVADAGWSVTEIRAWIDFRGGIGSGHVRRGSGLLATLLAGAHTSIDTPAKRAALVEHWRGTQVAMRRHRIQHVRRQREQFDGDWRVPADASVRQRVADAFQVAFRPSVPGGAVPGAFADSVPQDLDAEKAAGRALVQQELRAGDPSTVVNALHALGRDLTEELYGADLVHQATQLAALATSTLTTLGSR
ncbi:transcriptional regulator [Streptomyces sp. NBC_00237]|uniref:transcriptional regulator n=1 Tax=Streptomyces sp. NBC_00237 TaxID=2975687 RepID=UPI0022542DAC|nr:transcriptional regulator [Streptomyces sp. NBC_00237]MCX5207576.1 transcriptional regulator [Streptomyces sp. NBC_00237]